MSSAIFRAAIDRRLGHCRRFTQIAQYIANHPWIIYLRAHMCLRIQCARNAPTRGASAVEWVIITAVVVGIALGLALFIKNFVTEWQGKIEDVGSDKAAE
ncbi:hypothetical protein [Nonomuraea fuscirosea]|uniref:hypothetical protein n=1 Tax=Nonomuraea fuscirosea TaxID=1291556 RepID=UPI0034195FE6